nr:lytic murein transglycosylase B [Stutzerimonas stutzeri]
MARALCGAGLFGVFSGTQVVFAADYQGEKVAEFVREMTQDYGFASEQLVELLAQAERKQVILDAISRPAERVKPWKEYRPIFITDSRVAQGVDFWRENQAALERAEKEYGVPAEVVVAIIGVETFYGRNTGSYRVIDALSTLGFDYPPRQPFFRQQLKEFLLLAREEQVDPLKLTGSYAGAMGLPQFMPSSFRAYAVDFDGDGHIDIWKNPVDAIGSAANYFKQHGWVAGEPVVARATVKGEQHAEGLTEGLEPVKNAAQLRELGWQTEAEIADDTAVTAFRLDGAEGDEYWIGLPNFYVITRYNRSVMYAMAVHQLAAQLAEARGTQ